MQASARAASTGSMRDFSAPYAASAAVSKSSTQASTRGVSTGSERDFPRSDTLGTTVSNAIPIDDSPDPISVVFQGMSSKKRKRGVIKAPVVINISDDSDGGNSKARTNSATSMSKPKAKAPKPKRKRKPKVAEEPKDGEDGRVEKRLREFRERAPFQFQDRLDRAISQPMFLIDRERKMNSSGTHEIEKFDMAGTTGNVYEVTIDKKPKCTCMDATIRGNQCKHIIYVSRYVRSPTRRVKANGCLGSRHCPESSRASSIPTGSAIYRTQRDI